MKPSDFHAIPAGTTDYEPWVKNHKLFACGNQHDHHGFECASTNATVKTRESLCVQKIKTTVHDAHGKAHHTITFEVSDETPSPCHDKHFVDELDNQDCSGDHKKPHH